jgi:hypothetical protein
VLHGVCASQGQPASWAAAHLHIAQTPQYTFIKQIHFDVLQPLPAASLQQVYQHTTT